MRAHTSGEYPEEQAFHGFNDTGAGPDAIQSSYRRSARIRLAARRGKKAKDRGIEVNSAVNFHDPGEGGVDLLTRTTLQVDGVLSIPLIASVTRALQRVPGVLLAEVNAASSRAIVAHDAAVPTASLVAAAAAAGVHAEIVGETRTAGNGGSHAVRLHDVSNRNAQTVAGIVFLMLCAIDLVLPESAGKYRLLIALTILLWFFFLAKWIVGRPST